MPAASLTAESPLCPADLRLYSYPLCLEDSAVMVPCSPLENQISPSFRCWVNLLFVLLHRKNSFWRTEPHQAFLILLSALMVPLAHALPFLIYQAYSRGWYTAGSLKIKPSVCTWVDIRVFAMTKPQHLWKSQWAAEISPDVPFVPKNGKARSRSKPGSLLRLRCQFINMFSLLVFTMLT